jgi:predicted aldo/keto reductase-like oxidoreductase
MRYRRFGKTELQIPVISSGGMRFQHGWKDETDDIPEESQRNVEACVRHAVELGINHIETARGYGPSEYQLGKILPSFNRDDIIVQTKVGPDDDVDKFVANFERSMNFLKLDYIDLFGFHGINGDVELERTLKCYDKVAQWKKEGRIRHIGFSTHGPSSAIEKAIQTDLFEYVNLHWFYILQEKWPAVLEARKRDMGVFIISPNEKGGLLFKPSEKLLELCAPLHPIVFNGLFCMSQTIDGQDAIHTLSCGASEPAHYDVQMEVGEKSDNAAEWVAPVLARMEQAMADAVGESWATTWQQGLPQWHETPGEINMHVILGLYNVLKAYDMKEYGTMRYNLLGNGGSWFPGMKADKLDEVDLTNCLKDSPHADVIPGILRETHELLVGEEIKRLQEDE